jgi:hypothetical protein
MEGMSAIACWIAVGVLALFFAALILFRGIVFFHRPSPAVGPLPASLVVLTSAALALVAGFIHLVKARRTRISPKRKTCKLSHGQLRDECAARRCIACFHCKSDVRHETFLFVRQSGLG